MDEGRILAAEGKGYASGARKRESDGDKEGAAELYLKAANSFLSASKSSNTEEECTIRRELAETFYGKAMALKPRKRVKACADEGTGAEESSMLDIVPIEKPEVKFEDVGGMDSVKEDIKKAIVYPFQKPEIYEMYKKKVGGGILLYGPPGCGKTFIAKATAGECNASFITLKIGDILSKWLGESERNIRSAFDSARKYQPAILFFDEIDAIGSTRDECGNAGAKRVVNALLVELDGITGANDKRLTLAATNAPWAVDPALRRPGRFSKLLYLPPPDYVSREQIFKLHTRGRPIDEKVDFSELSKLTEGYSSADVAEICEESADIPLTEALAGGRARKIAREDFISTIENRKSSLIPWFKAAIKHVERSGESEIFAELLKDAAKYGA